MTIFNTTKLQVQKIKETDETLFMELLSAPEIINPVPQSSMTQDEILTMFKEALSNNQNVKEKERVVWRIYELDSTELIGLCGIITNDENQREIAYRYRKKYWGKGYGTEVAQGLIDYAFKVVKLELLAADANVNNMGSVKILEKYFTAVREFINKVEGCTDRRYILRREDWI